MAMSEAAGMAAARRPSQQPLISAGTRTARLRRECVRAAKKRCTHLCPALLLIPYVRFEAAMS